MFDMKSFSMIKKSILLITGLMLIQTALYARQQDEDKKLVYKLNIMQDIMPMWKVREQLVKSITLRVDIDRMKPEPLRSFMQTCDDNRGQCKLYFDVVADDLPESARLHARKFVIDPTPDLLKEAANVFGRDNVILAGE